jgi:DNA-binding Lrp family transcriptional regulator
MIVLFFPLTNWKKGIYKSYYPKMEYITIKIQKIYKYGNIFHNMQLDKKDLKILEILKQKANLQTSQISKKTSIPITTVHNRIKKLTSKGIIKNYTINIDFEKIGKPLKAYVLITVNQNPFSDKKLSQERIGEEIKKLNEVESVDIVTGETDLLAGVRIKEMTELNDLVTHKLRNIPGVDKTRTMMVLKEIN